MRRNYDLFGKVLDIIFGYDGEGDLTITFTPDNVAEGDRFLIFSAHKSITCTFIARSPIVVLFDCDEPILLEDCPDSFYESIIKNAPKTVTA